MRMDDPLVLPHLPETVMSPPAAMFFSARSVLGPSGLAYLSFTRSAHAIISFTTLIGTTFLSRMKAFISAMDCSVSSVYSPASSPSWKMCPFSGG